MWCLKFVPDTTPLPLENKFKALEGLFENPDAQPTNEAKMSFSERVGRARAVREMVLSPGWKIIEDIVSYGHKTLIARIGGEKDPMELKKLQGTLVGMVKLRQASIRVLLDGERAKLDMKEKNLGREPVPTPPET